MYIYMLLAIGDNLRSEIETNYAPGPLISLCLCFSLRLAVSFRKLWIWSAFLVEDFNVSIVLGSKCLTFSLSQVSERGSCVFPDLYGVISFSVCAPSDNCGIIKSRLLAASLRMFLVLISLMVVADADAAAVFCVRWIVVSRGGHTIRESW